MVNKGLHLADFVRFRSLTYTRTQQSLLPLWAAIIRNYNTFVLYSLMKLRKLKVTNKEIQLYMKKSRIFHHQYQRQMKICIPICICFMIGFLWSLYLYTLFL